jgi:hypothetical protein
MERARPPKPAPKKMVPIRAMALALATLAAALTFVLAIVGRYLAGDGCQVGPCRAVDMLFLLAPVVWVVSFPFACLGVWVVRRVLRALEGD